MTEVLLARNPGFYPRAFADTVFTDHKMNRNLVSCRQPSSCSKMYLQKPLESYFVEFAMP